MAKAPGSLETEVPQCCGEPKQWCQDTRYTAGGYFRCAADSRASKRKSYAALDGRAYNHLLLTHRRDKALARRRVRQEVQGG